MIELTDVRKVFNKGKPNEFVALRETSLSISSQQVTVIKGPSGSGKTTFLSLIGCMSRPTSGRIHVAGREITSLPERFLTEVRRTLFGFIFQQFNLIKGVTALENAMLPVYPVGEPHGVVKKRALELFEMFNLSQKRDAKVEWLSGGEAQRVAIVRALINDPSILIADEPTAHLDTVLSRELMETIARLKRTGKTVLVASHDPIVYDSSVVDRVITMRDGRIDGAA